jgi:hypothetical protein
MQELQKACITYCEKNEKVIFSDFEQLSFIEDGKIDVGERIKAILNTVYRGEEHRRRAGQSWSGKVVNFCVKLYPLSTFCLRLLAPSVEVC